MNKRLWYLQTSGKESWIEVDAEQIDAAVKNLTTGKIAYISYPHRETGKLLETYLFPFDIVRLKVEER